MYYLYILKCSDESLYTGITVDIERRLKEHNGLKIGAKYTAARRPVALVYSEQYATKAEAMREENFIKSLPRKEKLRLIHDKHIE